MAKKRKTLPDHVQEIIDSNDMERFKLLFEKCEISATNRGKTTQNIFSYRNLTLEHILFLIENGMDLNSDSGWGNSPAAFLADKIELLKCIIDHGADIEHAVDEVHGNALFICARAHRVQAVENLLACGANPEARGGRDSNTALDEALLCCGNTDIIHTVQIAKALLAAGATTSEKTVGYVKRIGENFEFMRSNFNKDIVDEYSRALYELYSIFNVEAVPRQMVYDGKTRITVRSQTWQKQYDELWNLLVPGVGHANTVQGEVIRIVGRISNEILDNGSINWDDEYRKMVMALSTYFQTFDGETTERACELTEKINENSDKDVLYQLTEITVDWVMKNNKPVPLDTVTYAR